MTVATTALATQLAPRALVAAVRPPSPALLIPLASGRDSTEGGHAQRVAHDAHGERRVTGGSAQNRLVCARQRPTPTQEQGGFGGTVDGDHTQLLLLVDLGGVLFRFDHEHRLNVLGQCQCLGLPPRRVDELLWQSGFSASCDAGRYRDAAAVRAQVRRITGYAGPDEDLDAAWCSAFHPDPEVTGLLARHPGSRRGVFTNNGPLEQDVLTRLYPDVLGSFGHLFFCWRDLEASYLGDWQPPRTDALEHGAGPRSRARPGRGSRA